MKKLIYLSAILLMSCVSNIKQNTTNYAINFKTIAQGTLHGAGSEGFTKSANIIKNISDWEALVNNISKSNNVPNNLANAQINFTKQSVIAIFDRVHGSGGFGINISKLSLNDNVLNINIQHKTPNGGNATAVMTQPYHIVVIDKINNNVRIALQ